MIVRGGQGEVGEGQSKCGYKRTTALMEMFYYLFFFFLECFAFFRVLNLLFSVMIGI